MLGTISVECAFRLVRENMNYRAETLRRVWPGRFKTNAMANIYAHNPEKLANYVYANRMGNGPPESGDGFRCRGDGPFQLTGKANHSACASAFGMTLDQFDLYMDTIEGGCMSAGWYWSNNSCNHLADVGGIDFVSMKVNVGNTQTGSLKKVVHLDKRRLEYKKALSLVS